MSESSYRVSLRSSQVIGGTQILVVLANIVKMKIAAVLIGPTGVGFVGLYTNLVQVAGSVASLGTGPVAIRQVARAKASRSGVVLGGIRKGLYVGTVALAIVGGTIFWFSSAWIAEMFRLDGPRAKDIQWLALGVLISVGITSQTALLTGLHRVGDLARINLLSASIGGAVGIAAIWFWRDAGIVVMVLSAPCCAFLVARVYIARLKMPAWPRLEFLEMTRQWAKLLPLSVSFMLSSLVLMAGNLVIRTIVQRELGADALGQLQAVWAISLTYLSFVLSAMATDYYPRLTAAVRDRHSATKLINEQTEVAMLLCAPVVLCMLALLPWVVPILYTSEFGPAVDVLRWQLLADVFKVLSWPLAFLIQARGDGRTFLLTESAAVGLLVFCIYLGLPIFGLKVTGIANLVLYSLYLPLVWWLARRWIDFRFSSAVRIQGCLIVALCGTVAVIAGRSSIIGAVTGMLSAAVMGLWALIRLASVAAATGRLSIFASVGNSLHARGRAARWISFGRRR